MARPLPPPLLMARPLAEDFFCGFPKPVAKTLTRNFFLNWRGPLETEVPRYWPSSCCWLWWGCWGGRSRVLSPRSSSQSWRCRRRTCVPRGSRPQTAGQNPSCTFGRPELYYRCKKGQNIREYFPCNRPWLSWYIAPWVLKLVGFVIRLSPTRHSIHNLWQEYAFIRKVYKLLSHFKYFSHFGSVHNDSVRRVVSFETLGLEY